VIGNARKITPTAANDDVRMKEQTDVTMKVDFVSYSFVSIGRDAGGGILFLVVVLNNMNIRVALNFSPSPS